MYIGHDGKIPFDIAITYTENAIIVAEPRAAGKSKVRASRALGRDIQLENSGGIYIDSFSSDVVRFSPRS